jgi:hypothetical protein
VHKSIDVPGEFCQNAAFSRTELMRALLAECCILII